MLKAVLGNNGLPQGSVLSPLLFNLYKADLPEMRFRKFAYADALAIYYQHKLKLPTKHALNEDPTKLSDYFET